MMVKKMKTADSEDDLIAAFIPFDPDETGKISEKQLRTIMMGLGEDITLDEMAELLTGIPSDDRGLIDYRAFTRAMLELAP